jgi:hypothetical protein
MSCSNDAVIAARRDLPVVRILYECNKFEQLRDDSELALDVSTGDILSLPVPQHGSRGWPQRNHRLDNGVAYTEGGCRIKDVPTRYGHNWRSRPSS